MRTNGVSRGLAAAAVRAAAVCALVLLMGCAPSAVSSSPSSSPAASSVPPSSHGPGGPTPPAGAFGATIVSVVDGDTVHALVPGRGEVKVRFIGIDTPETRRPHTPVQCYGHEATTATESLLPVGATVTAAFEAGHRTDRYGRDLWDVWLPDGRFLNGVLVSQGAAVARSYPPTTEHAGYLLALQQRAQAAGTGLWGACPGGEIPRHD